MAQMTNTHAKRLLKLARTLDSVSRKEFNMNFWWREHCSTNRNECGTAACALGWAGRIPAFRRLGLKAWLGRYGGGVSFAPTTHADQANFDESVRQKTETYPGYQAPATYNGHDAGQLFFGLTREEANRLFNNGVNNSTPIQVAGNIRRLVKKHHPVLYKADRAKKAIAA